MILMPASQLSCLLWPTRARARSRGEALRKVLQLGDKHPLNDRRLSEIWERSDEKTEEWISNTRGKQVAFDYIGNPAKLGDGTTTDECIYRGFNPETQVYTYRGVGFNLPAVAKALSDVAGRVNAVYRQMFPEQAKAEDEAMLSTWKQGMQALAALPNVHVKLSMVGYSVDGWNKDPALEAEVVSAFRTCIDLFGTNRCMVRSPRFA